MTARDSTVVLDQLIESFMERQRRGERPSVEEYIARHPELAEEIREVLSALLLIEDLGGPGPATGSFPSTRQASTAIPASLGEFSILREVGRGGMGIVYEALQVTLGRHVALKVLPPQTQANPMYLERFRREAQAAARLHHTNIVPVFAVGEHEGVAYYAMQFIRGQTLDAVLQELRRIHSAPNLAANTIDAMSAPARWMGGVPTTVCQPTFGSAMEIDPTARGADTAGGGLTISLDAPPMMSSAGGKAHYWRNVASIGVQVADALAYAHGQGLIHRDIKPSNLMLDDLGVVWVTDFGLAKFDGGSDLTNPGDIIGTLRYMAPEQLSGKADPHSDI